MSGFDAFWQLIAAEEKGFTNNPADPGNWTGGKCGLGELRGTKFGIAANTYPELDIANLTPETAQAIYRRDFWDKIRADEMPLALALQVGDAAVNDGLPRAMLLLHQALNLVPHGRMTDQLLAAVKAYRGPGWALCAEFDARRMAFMTALPTWKTFNLGWSRRLAALPWRIMEASTHG